MKSILELVSQLQACEGMLGLLRETGLNEAQQAYWDVINGQVQSIRRELLAVNAPSVAGTTPPTAPSRHRALIIDDDEMQRVFIARSLEKAGIEPMVARSGREAIELFKHESFDIIIMDCQMPDMDGFETTRSIRAIEGNGGGHVPIVAYTAHHIAGYKQLCLQSGMDEYLKKPLPISELGKEALRIISKHSETIG